MSERTMRLAVARAMEEARERFPGAALMPGWYAGGPYVNIREDARGSWAYFRPVWS